MQSVLVIEEVRVAADYALVRVSLSIFSVHRALVQVWGGLHAVLHYCCSSIEILDWMTL